MPDDLDLVAGSLSGFTPDDLLTSDFKDIMWDDEPHMEFVHNNTNAGDLHQFDLGQNLLSEKDTDKKVVLAAANAAGLNKGLKRAAFSMGDLQALQPSSSSSPPHMNPYTSTILETVPEGIPQFMGQMPMGMTSMTPVQYIITQPQMTMPQHFRHGAPPQQLSTMTIEEIEEQLRRSREAAAAGTAGIPSFIPTTQAQHAYLLPTVSNGIKTEQFSGYPSGPVVTVTAPLPSSGGMLPPAAKSNPSLGGLRRVQSAVELRRTISEDGAAIKSEADDGVYRIGKLTPEERREKILKYRQKRHERNFKKKIKYVCRKTLADSRPRVRGRFARNDDAGAKPPTSGAEAVAAN